MAHFLAQLEKTLGAEKWTNVYYLAADNLADAYIAASGIQTIERNVHKTTVHFSHILVSEREQPFRNYRSVSMDLLGLVTATSGAHALPLWNTVRCEFQPSNSGKPDVKQLRIPLYSDELLDIQHLTTTFHDFIQSNYVSALIGLGGIEDDAGNSWISGITRPEIFDRQLTKRRRKKVTV
jgi:hypothetical protein